MIIDFHTHIFTPEISGYPGIAMQDKNFRCLYSSPGSSLITHDLLAEAMMEDGVDASVIMGFPWYSRSHCERQNSYYLEVMNSHSEILPFGSVPMDLSNSSKNIHKYVEHLHRSGFRGIGEIGFYHEGFSKRHYGYLSHVLRSAREYSLPVCIHVNEPVGHSYNGKYDAGFQDLYRLLSENREVTVILSHWGGGLLFYELMPEVRSNFSSVYYDTAASPYLYEDTVYSIAPLLTSVDRILFGSDFPLIRPSRYIRAVREVLGKGKDADKILGLNAARVLNIG